MDECLEEHSFAWKHGAPESLCAGGRLRDQPLHLGIAADDSIQRHDVHRRYLGRERHEIALQKFHAVGVTKPPSLVSRSAIR